MAPFRPSREPREGEDPFLAAKMMLFVAGAIFGLVGMATERDWVLGIALLTLGAGMLLRIIGRDRGRPEDDREGKHDEAGGYDDPVEHGWPEDERDS